MKIYIIQIILIIIIKKYKKWVKKDLKMQLNQIVGYLIKIFQKKQQEEKK